MKKILIAVSVFLLTSCATFKSQTIFPRAEDLFITSGDGDITKPYTPIGQFIFLKTGFRIPLPLFGLIPIKDVDPDEILKTEVYSAIRSMGGNGLINMKIDWRPAKSGFLGLLANGGSVTIYGTVIKR